MLKMELYLRKKCKSWKGGSLRQFRQEQQYEAVRYGTEKRGISCGASLPCTAYLPGQLLPVALWDSRGRVAENQRIAQLVQEIHWESPDKGYRRIRDDLDKYYHTPVNDKRTLRICRGLGIQSVVKHAPHGCTSGGTHPPTAGGEMCWTATFTLTAPTKSGSPM